VTTGKQLFTELLSFLFDDGIVAACSVTVSNLSTINTAFYLIMLTLHGFPITAITRSRAITRSPDHPITRLFIPHGSEIRRVTDYSNTARPHLKRDKFVVLLELAVGYALILITVWTPNPQQRTLFWISAAWFFCSAVFAALRGEPLGLKRPPLRLTLVVVSLVILIGLGMVGIAAVVGTLHGLFGVRAPLLHAAGYLLWALVQQYIQQSFFFARIEQLTSNGLLAGFWTALLFSLAHLPNPVLTPVTFVGGWLLTELFRRYRTLYPLAIAHGLIGLAIAISVPDSLHHHMRVGLGYLRYPR
jgi:membrane protease YdiL (CAAX protease family)